MAFQPDPDVIEWRLHLASPPGAVYRALDSDEARRRFWAESADEVDGAVRFEFIDGTRLAAVLLDRRPGELWAIEYFGSRAEFHLADDGAGGTDLTLRDVGVAAADRAEVTAGWLNVLLPLKAWVDHGIDLRNHDPTRTWRQGYVDQ